MGADKTNECPLFFLIKSDNHPIRIPLYVEDYPTIFQNTCLIVIQLDIVGDSQLVLFAVSYHVFRYYSESACFSQNSRRVLFEIIRFIVKLEYGKKFSDIEQINFILQNFRVITDYSIYLSRYLPKHNHPSFNQFIREIIGAFMQLGTSLSCPESKQK